MNQEISGLSEKLKVLQNRAKFIFLITASLFIFLGFDRFLYSLTTHAEDLTEIQSIALIASYFVALLVYINVLFWMTVIIQNFKSMNYTSKASFFRKCLLIHFTLIGISLNFSTAVAIWIL